MSSVSDLLTKFLEVAALILLPPEVGRRGRCSLLGCTVLLFLEVDMGTPSAEFIDAVDITEVTAERSSLISANDELIETDFDRFGRLTIRRSLISWLKLRI